MRPQSMIKCSALAVFRRQSISYYRLFSVDELSARQLGATFPRFPATTQEDRLEWHEINELGRTLYEQVCSHFFRLSTHACSFSYDVHRHLVRPGQVTCALGVSLACPSASYCTCRCLQIMEHQRRKDRARSIQCESPPTFLNWRRKVSLHSTGRIPTMRIDLHIMRT